MRGHRLLALTTATSCDLSARPLSTAANLHLTNTPLHHHHTLVVYHVQLVTIAKPAVHQFKETDAFRDFVVIYIFFCQETCFILLTV